MPMHMQVVSEQQFLFSKQSHGGEENGFFII
jgi:hypothetical protein